ncbi:non-structural maintenance of chromosomes element 4 homolog A [Ceratina calcarata]|uniref:Non-structural maintenance of chromosomes element 4 n=1 Tax=Ceratina calcarata TaxID=156304 RepID=A0AAJ7N9M6_9HYME|nr:non-structural maintenance of chromosomes element 4 homolog A [Ceratina calcarata]
MTEDSSSSSGNKSRRESLLLSPLQKKEKLRSILTKVECLEDSITDMTIETLKTCMNETDEIDADTSLREKVQNQEIILLDSEMMHVSSRILQSYKRSLRDIVSVYDEVEFAHKVMNYIRQNSNVETETPDWSVLESEVTKLFRVEPQYSSFLGTLEPLERKETIKRASIVKAAKAQVKRPENVTTVEKEGESIELTVKIYKLISKYCKNNKKPLDYFRLVLDPTDFGKTVQNILQISFLVRDGHVEIKDSGDALVIVPTKERRTQAATEERPNVQNVIYLNMEQWKSLKDVYRLEKPMIDFDT